MELLRCPFCGGDDIYISRKNMYNWTIECLDDFCGCKLYDFTKKEDAIEAWNTRNQWIPVSERLPEILIGDDVDEVKKGFSKMVLVNCSGNSMYVAWRDINSLDNANHGFVSDGDFDEVTHWMPLPQKPENK